MTDRQSISRSWLILILVWATANLLPHLVVYLLTGTTYYYLPRGQALVAETSIILINLILPVFVVRKKYHSWGDVLTSLGWRWTGRKAVIAGAIGLISFFAVAILTQQLIGDPLSQPGEAITSPLEIIWLFVLLLGLTAFGEETMFRGYLQGHIGEIYRGTTGESLAITMPAFLFGIRHLPMDMYAAAITGAPPSAWLSRLIQLYLGAILFGLVRKYGQSTWASWIMHQGVLVLILLLGALGS